jgi:hypothetical protein
LSFSGKTLDPDASDPKFAGSSAATDPLDLRPPRDPDVAQNAFENGNPEGDVLGEHVGRLFRIVLLGCLEPRLVAE